MTSTTPIRTVIVDDCEEVRFLLGALLDLDGRFEVVGEAGDARSGFRTTNEVIPDLVVIDLCMVGRGGIWLLQRLRRTLGSRVRLAVVTGYADADQRAEAIGAGADVVLGKETMTSGLSDSLAALVPGRRPLTPA